MQGFEALLKRFEGEVEFVQSNSHFGIQMNEFIFFFFLSFNLFRDFTVGKISFGKIADSFVSFVRVVIVFCF